MRRATRTARSQDDRQRFEFFFLLFCSSAFYDRRRAYSEDNVFRYCADGLYEVGCANDVRIFMCVYADVMARIAFAFACFLCRGYAFLADIDCGLAGQFFSYALSSFSAYDFVYIIAFRAFRHVSNASMDCAATQGSAFFSDYANDTRYVIGAIFLFFRFCFTNYACMRGYCAA